MLQLGIKSNYIIMPVWKHLGLTGAGGGALIFSTCNNRVSLLIIKLSVVMSVINRILVFEAYCYHKYRQ